MRIVVNNIAASSGGAISILIDFYDYIKAADEENEWIFLLSDNYIEETTNIHVIKLDEVKKSWVNKLRFDFLNGKKYIRKLNPDVVFSMQNIITFGLKYRQVLYIHQSIPFQTIKKFSFFKSKERRMAIYQYLIGRVIIESAKRADKIIVQSNWMKNALCSKMNKDSNKIVCIYPSINDCSKYRKDNEFNPHSFFYPTSSYIYKNNECIYQASRFLNRKGIQNFNVKMTVHIDGKHPNIDFIGRIPREQVLEEYNRSTLILPSYIESFPLPLEEAKQMGTIILASDCDFSREILDDYENAYYFNPFCPEKLSDLMEKVLNKSIVRKDIKHESINKDLKSYRGWEAVVESILLKD